MLIRNNSERFYYCSKLKKTTSFFKAGQFYKRNKKRSLDKWFNFTNNLWQPSKRCNKTASMYFYRPRYLSMIQEEDDADHHNNNNISQVRGHALRHDYRGRIVQNFVTSFMDYPWAKTSRVYICIGLFIPPESCRVNGFKNSGWVAKGPWKASVLKSHFDYIFVC